MNKGKSSLILFLFLLIILPLFWFTIVAPYKTSQSLLSQVKSTYAPALVDQFPSDLIINVKNGVVSLNKPAPYCFILDQKTQTGLVFDTKNEAKITALDGNGPYAKLCKAVGVIGKDYLMYSSGEQLKIQKIPAEANFTLDRVAVKNFVDSIMPKILAFGQKAYLALPFVLIIPVFLFFLSNNLWYSFVAGLVLKAFKLTPSVSVYGTTLLFYTIITAVKWILVDFLLNGQFGQTLDISFPFLNTILISLATLFYVKSHSSTSSPTGQ